MLRLSGAHGGTTQRRVQLGTVGTVAVTLLVAGCAGGTGADDGGAGGSASSGTVTLVTHDSWAIDEKLVDRFEEESGLTVEVSAAGDAGTLVNQLVLTKDAPLGDAVFGIDNTFASRALDAGVLEEYTPADLPEGVEQAGGALTAVDQGDVCVNADEAWFEKEGLEVPATLEDLADPRYRDLLVVTNPATSSPGLAFLLATIGAFGEDGYEDYWASLVDNGVKVADSWEDAYYVDFSGAGEGGQRPLALSYATSPAFTVTEDGTESTTSALLETCFRQVEYAGVLAGSDNPEGARELVDFLLTADVQAGLPESMYMYPADPAVGLPEDWQRFAPQAEAPFEVDPADVSEHRDEWIERWTETVVG
ncbi:thiamine ABC transporter substrate binding subunit [Promicromonospora thailandica]|uniref:Thiamine transport system substrate-binding protein n=1 Tax=Promicromonospora thailandica TaxID=765201 RepID=A0A9X2JX80_9MICO|nr:thiamine ABC transporter substrate-binding protein [Promicromonospora thailandica]MCP2266282.1 thiamine transport system substrate-binding protein [Promicromonospora thailandica]BFF19949.1 thiamine ABC transporter substrate-binding protein [Promicromonospora thailandica]